MRTADSMAVEPLSEKKTLFRALPGERAASSAASCAAGGCVKPRNDVCATRSSCALIAAVMRGWLCPWMLVQMEELPSR